MESFSRAVAAWADERQVPVILRRNDGSWDAVIVFKDSVGEFETIVREQDVGDDGKPGEYNKRIFKALTAATISARRSRIGQLYSSLAA